MATPRKRKVDAVVALSAGKEADIQSTVAAIGELSRNVQGTLAGLGVTLAGKINDLQQLDTALAAKREELKELNDIEVTFNTLEELQNQREAATALAEKEAALVCTAATIADQLAQQEAYRRGEAIDFKMVQLERDHTAKLQGRIDAAKREETFRQEDVTRDIDNRVSLLVVREAKVEELEERVAGIPDEIKKAADKQTAIVSNTLKQHHAHEIALLQKDVDGRSSLSYSKIAALESAAETADARIVSLEEQLASANDRAKDIATAAVEATGQQQALTTLQNAMQSQSTPASGRGR